MLGYILKIKFKTIIYLSLLSFIFIIILKFHDQILSYDEELPVILWWTPFFNDNELKYLHCGSSKCIRTENRDYYFNKSDATIVFLFYGSSFTPYDLPLPRQSNQKWALIHEESPKNVGLFLHKDSHILFNFTSTFSRNSHFPITLQYLSNINALTGKEFYRSVEEKNKLLKNLAPVLYIQSDCVTPLERDSYVVELMKFIQIDSYGKCLNNKLLPKKLSQKPLENLYSPDYLNFVSQYKFIIAFENAVCDDYITEKLWRPLIVGSIPIFMGSNTIKDWLPNNRSAIVATDFSSPKELAEFIIKINTNDSLYNSYLEHKLFETINNKLLKETLINRDWIIDDSDGSGKHFFEAFECFICDNINNIFNYDVIHNSIYNCPDPVSPLTHKRNNSNWWLNFWREGRCQAHILKKFVNDLVLSNYSKHLFDYEYRLLMEKDLC